MTLFFLESGDLEGVFSINLCMLQDTLQHLQEEGMISSTFLRQLRVSLCIGKSSSEKDGSNLSKMRALGCSLWSHQTLNLIGSK